jgi:hypothetical protein
MNAPKVPIGIRHFLLFGMLGLFVLMCAVPARAITYAYDSPLAFVWGHASGSVDHYNVYVSVDGGPFELLGEETDNTCQVVAQEGQTYVVQVEAEDALGQVGPMSDPSDEVAVFLSGSPNDTDGDGMTNAWEASYGLNPFDPSDATADPDDDSLANLGEFNTGTDPTDPDTDDDGYLDGEDPYPLDPLNGETNSRPVADAGEDQDLDPTVVTLDGSGSHDPDQDLLSYSWTQREGPEVELTDSHIPIPAFLGKTAGEYVFELVVSDGTLLSLPDNVLVTIRNVPPAADAGPDHEVSVGTEVVLDGSDSADPNEDPLSYSWTQIAGTQVALQGANSDSASFIPEQSGVYVFELVTFDGQAFSPPDEAQVIVNAPVNHVPTAHAGEDQTVKAGDTVTLDGSGSSDPDGDPLMYAWSQVEGPETVVLEGATTVEARFEAPGTGQYRFRLVVNDGKVDSPPDEVAVTVETATNQAPVAVVGDVDPVEVWNWVTLDGSGSFDPDEDPLTYIWSQTGGPLATLTNPDSPVTGFYAVTEGTVTFQLLVHDRELMSLSATVEVQILAGDPPRVEPPGLPPRVQADRGGGCSVSMRGGPQHKVDTTDIGYLLTLFVPAIGAVWYQKRRYRRRKGLIE